VNQYSVQEIQYSSHMCDQQRLYIAWSTSFFNLDNHICVNKDAFIHKFIKYQHCIFIHLLKQTCYRCTHINTVSFCEHQISHHLWRKFASCKECFILGHILLVTWHSYLDHLVKLQLLSFGLTIKCVIRMRKYERYSSHSHYEEYYFMLKKYILNINVA